LDVIGEQVAPEEARQFHAEALESGCALPLISRGRTLGVSDTWQPIRELGHPEDVDFLCRRQGSGNRHRQRLAYREIAELKDKLAQENCIWKMKSVGEMAL